jgi:hypothetical protein
VSIRFGIIWILFVVFTSVLPIVMSIIYLLAQVPVRCNGEKLCFALSIKFNKLVSVSLSFSMLSCQSEFGHHAFLVFLLASSIAMSSSRQFLQCSYSSCSNLGEFGCALPRHWKAHNTTGAMAMGHLVTRG